MRKLIKNIFWTGAVVMMTLQAARAFSPIGPAIGGGLLGDLWEQPIIGYGLAGDVGTPKNIGEAYRRVTPVMYYAMDSTFINFFGLTGTTNIDAAFAMMNGVLCGQTNNSLFLSTSTNGILSSLGSPYIGTQVTLSSRSTLDGYTTSLADFPLESQQFNYTAAANLLLDLKSVTLNLLMEQMGLAEPERYTWTLYDRYLPAGGRCPANEEYIVVQRNYDFLNSSLNQLQYSPYVNDTLYTYEIVENCAPPNPVAETAPYAVDIYADSYTSVASFELNYGGYYTGLTRDDVGGLRYLLSSNNITWEATAPSGSQLFTISTNSLAPQVFPPNGALAAAVTAAGYYYYDGTYGYGDLAALLAYAKTNNLATLQAAYPGLVVSSVGISWALATNQTYSSHYAPAPVGSPYGSPPQLVVVTNYTPYYQFLYSYTFGNVFTNHYSAQSTALRQIVSASAPTGSPYGTTFVTNNTTLKLTGQMSGDFFVLPPFYEGVCPLDIVSYPGIASVLATTNLLTSAFTNTAATNFSSSVYLITYFTNYQYVIYPVTCTQGTALPALREGIGHSEFMRANYDSLLGQFFQPLTNDYTMVMITNSQKVTEHYRRVVTQPDFLLRAANMLSGPSAAPAFNIGSRNLNFDQSQVSAGLAGPGTIVPSTTITYNKVGNFYANGEAADELSSTNAFLGTVTQGSTFALTNGLSVFLWASFDGSTNLPVVYPDGTSLANIVNQLYIQVTPTTVPDGTVGVSYNGGTGVTFTATGGQPPYTWAAPNVSALVPGMSFDPATATLSGTPTASGTFTFILQLTDAVNRVVNLNYLITIH